MFWVIEIICPDPHHVFLVSVGKHYFVSMVFVKQAKCSIAVGEVLSLADLAEFFKDAESTLFSFVVPRVVTEVNADSKITSVPKQVGLRVIGFVWVHLNIRQLWAVFRSRLVGVGVGCFRSSRSCRNGSSQGILISSGLIFIIMEFGSSRDMAVSDLVKFVSLESCVLAWVGARVHGDAQEVDVAIELQNPEACELIFRGSLVPAFEHIITEGNGFFSENFCAHVRQLLVNLL